MTNVQQKESEKKKRIHRFQIGQMGTFFFSLSHKQPEGIRIISQIRGEGTRGCGVFDLDARLSPLSPSVLNRNCQGPGGRVKLMGHMGRVASRLNRNGR